MFLFEGFTLDPRNRRLRRGAEPVELNARYFDALALLVGEAGGLVTKDRFLDEVWSGVPVTDEALTQCIRTLRRQLGDDAARPRFIETVPKHGYRFIAPVERHSPALDGEGSGVEWTAGSAEPFRGVHPHPGPPPARGRESGAPPAYGWRQFLLLGGAGTIGAGVAGVIGGLAYGFAGAAGPGMGAASVLLVLLWLTIAAALTGGAGVSFGIAAAGFAPNRLWGIAGGALGGLVVGGVVKLLGLDAFNLLLGRSPGDITGAAEGALLGGAVGLGAWLGSRCSLRRGVAIAGLVGAAAGLLITLAGGRMMGGSLDLLARAFPDSRLRLDPIGAMLGERGFGPLSEGVTGGLEGMLFGGCIVGAIMLARRGIYGDGSGGGT
ncbi:MAG TPA: transcriptional regulator [Allosphingosinicella sp.]|nr:transcriptional regulator [Allosphingosinicella sp.]